MKRFGIVVIGMAMLASVQCGAESQTDDRIDQALERFASLQSSLQSELAGAMREGGPVAAIATCHVSSPRIESEQSGEEMKIRRVSDRPRNPTHAADEFEARVIADWKRAREAGEELEVVAREHDGRLRVMKPIVINNGLCLQCHGSAEQVSTEVRQSIAELYPNDQAMGYEMGDVRGAFSATFAGE